MKFGYIRVSTREQNVDRQLDALQADGCERIFIDKVTGKSIDPKTKKTAVRPEFDKMWDMLRPGDVIVVNETERLGRNYDALMRFFLNIRDMNVGFRSLTEPMLDTTARIGDILDLGPIIFSIVAAFSEFRGKAISSATSEGLAAARARGRVGGRPKVPQEKINKALKLYDTKVYSISEICKLCDVSKSTLYKYLIEKE